MEVYLFKAAKPFHCNIPEYQHDSKCSLYVCLVCVLSWCLSVHVFSSVSPTTCLSINGSVPPFVCFVWLSESLMCFFEYIFVYIYIPVWIFSPSNSVVLYDCFSLLIVFYFESLFCPAVNCFFFAFIKSSPALAFIQYSPALSLSQTVGIIIFLQSLAHYFA